MASLNKVFLLGNLTRDPDFRGLPAAKVKNSWRSTAGPSTTASASLEGNLHW